MSSDPSATQTGTENQVTQLKLWALRFASLIGLTLGLAGIGLWPYWFIFVGYTCSGTSDTLFPTLAPCVHPFRPSTGDPIALISLTVVSSIVLVFSFVRSRNHSKRNSDMNHLSNGTEPSDAIIQI